MNRESFEFAIVGGGIAGLSTAYEILQVRPEASLVVIEAAARLGGNIRTTHDEGFTVEWGVNGFLDNVPETLDLVGRLGLDGNLLRAAESAGRRFIFREGRLREVPLHPGRFLASDLLSLKGRLRVLGEPFARARPEGDETVFDFAARRIGREAAAILVDAMVSGVYAGDSRALSLASTFPRMREMEETHGSLVRAMIHMRREARSGSRNARDSRARSGGGPVGPGGVLTSFDRGMETLIRRLSDIVGADRIRLATEVKEVSPVPSPGGYSLRVAANGSYGMIEAGRVIVAAPARAAARFLSPLDEGLSEGLAGIAYAPLAVVALAYRGADLAQVPQGFGFLAPHGQGLRILGCLWDSSIFPPRAPEGSVLVRGMIGGACDADAERLSDPDLEETMRHDLRIAMGIDAKPRKTWIFRHPLGIPQYTLGHGERMDRITACLVRHPGLELVGNSYHGVAVNSCVKEARELAIRIGGGPL